MANKIVPTQLFSKPEHMGNLSRNVVISDTESDSDSDIAMAIENNKKHSKKTLKKEKEPSFNTHKVKSKPVILDDSRRWEDDKERKQELKRGSFEPKETILLMKALCQYCSENNLEESDLMTLVSEKNSQHKGAWPTIASVLPDRSVQACHNHCRRKFNPYNYKGPWTEDEVQMLLTYVDKYGKEWEKIAGMIGRTALNVRDKYKEIGGKNSSLRKISKWTAEETI
jgi:hypothetical protein